MTIFKNKSYHHKDLKNALIEYEIELVNVKGIKAFFLRKVAAAAPYSHFQNKEELLNAMQQYITDRFSEVLKNTIKKYEHKTDLLKYIGIAYISFFIENPTYFSFLYSQSNIKIDLILSIPDKENYKPYIIYKNIIMSLLEQTQYSYDKQNDIVVTLWSFIHGITSLSAMNFPVFLHDKDGRNRTIVKGFGDS